MTARLARALLLAACPALAQGADATRTYDISNPDPSYEIKTGQVLRIDYANYGTRPAPATYAYDSAYANGCTIHSIDPNRIFLGVKAEYAGFKGAVRTSGHSTTVDTSGLPDHDAARALKFELLYQHSGSEPSISRCVTVSLLPATAQDKAEREQERAAEAERVGGDVDEVIRRVRGYAKETFNGDAHVGRWLSVLKALGDAGSGFDLSGVAPMTLTQAKGFAKRFSADRWDPVVVALERVEDAKEPVASINDVSVAEGERAVFTVSLSKPASRAVTIGWRTRDGTAVADVNPVFRPQAHNRDYVRASGTLTIKAGGASGEIAVRTLADTVIESLYPDRFTVQLRNPVGASLAAGAATGTATITDATQPGRAPASITTESVSVSSLIDPQIPYNSIRLTLPPTFEVYTNYSASNTNVLVNRASHKVRFVKGWGSAGLGQVCGSFVDVVGLDRSSSANNFPRVLLPFDDKPLRLTYTEPTEVAFAIQPCGRKAAGKTFKLQIDGPTTSGVFRGVLGHVNVRFRTLAEEFEAVLARFDFEEFPACIAAQRDFIEALEKGTTSPFGRAFTPEALEQACSYQPFPGSSFRESLIFGGNTGPELRDWSESEWEALVAKASAPPPEPPPTAEESFVSAHRDRIRIGNRNNAFYEAEPASNLSQGALWAGRRNAIRVFHDLNFAAQDAPLLVSLKGSVGTRWPGNFHFSNSGHPIRPEAHPYGTSLAIEFNARQNALGAGQLIVDSEGRRPAGCYVSSPPSRCYDQGGRPLAKQIGFHISLIPPATGERMTVEVWADREGDGIGPSLLKTYTWSLYGAVGRAEVIRRVREYANESFHGQAHVGRWLSVLKALGDTGSGHDLSGVTAMTLAQAKGYAAIFKPDRWDPVVQLMGEQAGASICASDQLKADVAGYALETGNGDAHVAKWKRVGHTFAGTSGNPFTVAEAERESQTNAAHRWNPVVAALRCLQGR